MESFKHGFLEKFCRFGWGGGGELNLKQVHLFLTLWQSQFLLTLGGGGEKGVIFLTLKKGQLFSTLR